MIYIVLAVILFIDLWFIFYKLKNQGFIPAFVDLMILIAINSVMGGSLGGEIIGTIAAFLISVYLWFYPPKLSLIFSSPFKTKPTRRYR